MSGSSADPINQYSNGVFYRTESGLTDIPDDIPDDVTHLFLYDNAIERLSTNVFTHLSQCINLDLTDNHISEIELGALNGLENLRNLSLAQNQLTVISSNIFSPLSPCTQLNISSNYISELQTGTFNGLDNLQTLLLDGNNLRLIPPNIFSPLTSCRKISLRKNAISEIHSESFIGLENLRYLYLEDNQLAVIHSNVFNHLSACIRLHIDKNKIVEIQNDAFSGMISLEFLYIEDTKVVESLQIDEGAFNDLQKLRLLFLSENIITVVKPSLLEGLREVVSVHMDRNKISKIIKGSFRNLENIRTLNMQYNMLTNLESFLFFGMTSLVYLFLADNQIATIEPNAFAGLTSLRLLKLDYNKLELIRSDMFADLTTLEELTLHRNTLTTLEFGVFDRLPRPLFIRLSSIYSGKGNSWICDSSLCWLKEEEQLGLITFTTKLHRLDYGPSCTGDVSWDFFNCSTGSKNYFSFSFSISLCRWHIGSAFIFCSGDCPFKSEPSPSSAYARGQVAGCATGYLEVGTCSTKGGSWECTLHLPQEITE